MTLRKMPGTDIYEYRFQYRGRRYQRTTGQSTLREAERIERAAREEVMRQSPNRGASGPHMTLKRAVGLYLATQGAKPTLHARTHETEKKFFREMLNEIGPDTLMSDLDFESVARVVQKRRNTPRTNARGKVLVDEAGKPQRLQASYVNRYTSKLLKRVYIMARDEWGVAVKPIKWSSPRILLKEGPLRSREIKLEEEDRIVADEAFREGYGECFHFALLSGMRKANFTQLRWNEVDWGHREIDFMMKAGRRHKIVMTDEMFDLLRRQRGFDPEFVFTFVPKRESRHRPKGVRRPMTYSGFTSWYRRLVKRLGYDLTIHDIRRTTGSRIVRQTSNLKAAQQHLGHADISTTAKFYAHLQKADMVKVLNQTSEATKAARTEMEASLRASDAA